MRAGLVTCALALAMSCAVAREGAAEPPATRVRTVGAPVRIGFVAGWFATAGDLDVLGERVQGNEPSPGPAFGLRLGWRVTPGWGLELTAGAIPAGSEALVPVLAELRWRPLEGHATWTPTIALGAGVMAGLGPGADVDTLLSATTGLEIALGTEVGVHLTGGVWASDAVSGALAWSPVVMVGIELRAWRDTRVRAASEADTRPLKAPPVVRGCPSAVPVERCADFDEDGIIDAFDACPLEPGGDAGCPDDDGDGVDSRRDACPLRRGTTIDWGCPRSR